jgi:hypothetical protein
LIRRVEFTETGGNGRRFLTLQCANCEPRSYLVHDPMDIFFKLPRPVDRALEPPHPFLPILYVCFSFNECIISPIFRYKSPAGPGPGSALNSNHPKGLSDSFPYPLCGTHSFHGTLAAYLSSLHHNAALCDHCMERISGEWFRCVYCAKDLCDVCENLNAHDRTHFFYVFKAPVSNPVTSLV